MRYKDLKLGTKQKVGFGSILLLVVITNIYFFSRIEEIKVEIDDLTANRIPRVIAISDINQTTTELRLVQLQLAAADQSDFRAQLQLRSIELLDQINDSRDIYESLRAADTIRADSLGEDAERDAGCVQDVHELGPPRRAHRREHPDAAITSERSVGQAA